MLSVHPPRPLWTGLCIVVGAMASTGLAQSPFASRVLEYAPAPGQFVQNPQFNDPAKALGAPGTMGGLAAGDNSKCVSLGGFGGTITLGFDHSIWANPHNPRGIDFIVYGNSFFVTGDPLRRHSECGVVEVSRDDNGNGLADDAWFLIPGSHLATNATRTMVQWDAAGLNPLWVPPGRSGIWTSSGYLLSPPPPPPQPSPLFGPSPVFTNTLGTGAEQVWGYADTMPTLLRGDTQASNAVDDPAADAGVFYAAPDDPMVVGVSAGSGGGAAMRIAWAVNTPTGLPAGLDRIDFVRITTGVNAVDPILGEISTEISAVADVGPVYHADWNHDGMRNVSDIFAFLTSWFAGVGEHGGADFDSSGTTTVADIFAFLGAWFGA